MTSYNLVNKGAGWKLKCPKCGQWLYIDDDQFYGRVSTWHDTPECGYHETVNFSEHMLQKGEYENQS